jgi:hypothetical protein
MILPLQSAAPGRGDSGAGFGFKFLFCFAKVMDVRKFVIALTQFAVLLPVLVVTQIRQNLKGHCQSKLCALPWRAGYHVAWSEWQTSSTASASTKNVHLHRSWTRPIERSSMRADSTGSEYLVMQSIVPPRARSSPDATPDTTWPT